MNRSPLSTCTAGVRRTWPPPASAPPVNTFITPKHQWMQQYLLRGIVAMSLLLALSWTTLQAQEFQFEFKGPDTLYADNNCEAILTLDMDSLTVISLVGANVTDTTLTITGQYMLGDIIPAGTVVTFNWTALDDQGNDSIFVFTITVVDTLAPNFSAVLPADITVACDNVPNPPVVTIFDNCDPNPVLTYNQVAASGPCVGNYSLTREWIATDNYGNQRSHVQIITVFDADAPVLTGIPGDTTVLCNQIPLAPIIGVDILALDKCDTMPLVSFVETTLAGACTNDFTIIRTWTATDECNNSTTSTQTLTVIDTIPPVLLNIPADITVACEAVPGPPFIGPGGIGSTDNCDNNASLIFGQSSNQDPNPADCGHYNYQITRTWTSTDDCGNITSDTQLITVEDNEAPTLYCPSPDTIVVDPGICHTNGSVAKLLFASDNCTPSGSALLVDTMDILNTSGTPLLNGVVDNILFTLPFTGLPTNFVTGNIQLTIGLINADAEQPTEYYRIYSENGDLLGQTLPTPVQCGSVQTVIANLTADQINLWAQDGFINVVLIPEGNGVEAINQICVGGKATIALSFNYDITPPAGLSLSYRVDNGAYKNLSSGTEMLAPGNYQITVLATDCSGNADSCAYSLSVLDREIPLLICPSDLQISTGTTSCSAMVTMPFPVDAWDNCGFPTNYQGNLPAQPMVFFNDPNAGIVPQDIVSTFQNTMPSGPGFGSLQVILRADIADPGEFFEVFGENNTFLGITGPASPLQECTQEAVFTFFIDENQMKAWSADGQMQFRLVSNKDVISFNEFVNPCGTLQPNGTDGISYARFALSYNAIQTTYAILENPGGNQVASGTLINPANPPQHLLNIGNYTVTYELEDADGNIATCNWQLAVGDEVPPFVNCKPGLFVKTNPSGLVNHTVTEATLLQTPATDNCGLSHFEITPNTFTCNDSGNNYNVRLIAFDLSGNSDTCFSLVAVQNEELSPMFALDTCGGNLLLIPDTTFTYPSPGLGDYFVFNWSSSNGFASNQSHPLIPNPKESDSGVYTLTVQGLTGCTSTGSVIVDIGPGGAFRPVLESNSPVCQGDSIRLSTDWQGAVRYDWMHSSSGTLIQTTQPLVVLPAALVNGGSWTLQVYPDLACPSSVSLAEVVVINAIDVQLPLEVAACEGDMVSLPANAVNVALFTWTTPNGTIYLGQNPMVPAMMGTYYLLAESPQGCVIMDSLTINLLQRPVITALSHSCPECVSGVEECELVPTIFPAGSAGEYFYTWTNPGGAVFSADSIAQLTNVTGASSGLYTLQVEKLDNTCRSAPFSLFITLNDRPVTPEIGVNGGFGANPYEVCDGEQVILQVMNTTYTGNVRFVWQGPLGSDTTSIPSFTIPSITLNQGGSYNLEVIVNGCTSNSSNVQQITVNPIPFPPVVTSNSPICAGDTLQLCGDFQAGALYEWLGPQGTYGPDYCLLIPNATTNLSGPYQVRIGVKGCFSAFTNPEEVLVRANPAAPIITDNCNGRICRDVANNCMLTVLSPDPNAQFYWYAAGVDTLIGSSGNSPFMALSFPGNYLDGQYGFYAVAETDGCRSTSSVIHTLEINTIPDLEADAGPDVAVCDGEVLTLCAQQPAIGTGQWAQTTGPASTILNPESTCTQIQGYTPGGIMTYQWVLSNGACVNFSSDQVTATISQFENALATSPISLCRSEATQISASAGQFGPGQWSQTVSQEALGIVIAAPGTPNSGISGLQGGNTYYFQWTLANGACAESSVEVQVNNYDDQAFAGNDRDDCGQGCISLPLNADFPTLGQGRWYTPQTSISVVQTGETTATACGLQQGPNVFIWELNDGICGESSYDTMVVNYALGPQAVNDTIQVPFAGQSLINVLPNDNVYGAVTTVLTGMPGEGTLVKVSEGNYIYTPPIQFTGSTQFRYRICSTVCPNVCTEATIFIEVVENSSCDVPTIITPNRDGINDALVIPCLASDIAFPHNSLSIFNQWGDEVYRATPYANNWEGTYNGQLLPAGTYFFVFEPGNDEPVSSGFILIKY